MWENVLWNKTYHVFSHLFSRCVRATQIYQHHPLPDRLNLHVKKGNKTHIKMDLVNDMDLFIDCLNLLFVIKSLCRVTIWFLSLVTCAFTQTTKFIDLLHISDGNLNWIQRVWKRNEQYNNNEIVTAQSMYVGVLVITFQFHFSVALFYVAFSDTLFVNLSLFHFLPVSGFNVILSRIHSVVSPQMCGHLMIWHMPNAFSTREYKNFKQFMLYRVRSCFLIHLDFFMSCAQSTINSISFKIKTAMSFESDCDCSTAIFNFNSFFFCENKDRNRCCICFTC